MTTTKPMVAVPLEQPAPELHARRVQYVIKTIEGHQHRMLLDPTRCACGEPVAEGVPALQRHAVEQLLISLPETPVVEVPAAAGLIDRAVDELLEDGGPDDEESLDRTEFWHHHVTRMHNRVYAPLITALVDELRTVGLGWETLAEHYAVTLEEHRQERDSLRDERDHLRTELRDRNRAYGRASTTIGELRAHNVWLRDQRFDAMTNRGAAIADLVATQRQVRRQQDTIRDLLTRVRELGGTVDDAELLGLADTAPAATPAVSIQ